jgi:hypothetical protein
MQQEDIKHIEALNDIRTMMRKSSRFLSLSGLSGIFAGIYALGGFYAAKWYIFHDLEMAAESGPLLSFFDVYGFFILDALLVMTLSLITAYLFSSRKAKKNGSKLFDHTAWRLFWQMMVPLAAGGALSFALLFYGYLAFIAPVMLCFYGCALFSASKLTYDDVKYLGLAEIVLGVISAFDLGNGLFYWALGFGVCHILYGAIMWWKYEREHKFDTKYE